MLRKIRLMTGVLVAATAVLATGCDKGGVDQIDCASADVPAFADVSIWPSCTGCHASTLEGADREGAPVNINFDVYETAKTYADDASNEVAEGGMPPSGSVTEEQKQSLYTWAQCGTPE